MNKDIVQGKWRQVLGGIQQLLARRKNDDRDRIEGSRNQMIGLIQERRGYARDGRRRPGDRGVKGYSQLRYSEF